MLRQMRSIDQRLRNMHILENMLSRLKMVKWDRFTFDAEGERQWVLAYGWIDRPDAHKDFIVVDYWPEVREMHLVQTSSPDSENLMKQIDVINNFGKPSQHNKCRRIEDYFQVPNCIRLKDSGYNKLEVNE